MAGRVRTVKFPIVRDQKLVELCAATGKSPNFLINKSLEFALKSKRFRMQVEKIGAELNAKNRSADRSRQNVNP